MVDDLGCDDTYAEPEALAGVGSDRNMSAATIAAALILLRTFMCPGYRKRAGSSTQPFSRNFLASQVCLDRSQGIC